MTRASDDETRTDGRQTSHNNRIAPLGMRMRIFPRRPPPPTGRRAAPQKHVEQSL
jgi:hypothetical protein